MDVGLHMQDVLLTGSLASRHARPVSRKLLAFNLTLKVAQDQEEVPFLGFPTVSTRIYECPA